MDDERLLNFDEAAISPQVSCKNSSTGMVHQTVGCEDAEKDCWAFAGSYRLIKEEITRYKIILTWRTSRISSMLVHSDADSLKAP
jgi:hypothetical protein